MPRCDSRWTPSPLRRTAEPPSYNRLVSALVLLATALLVGQAADPRPAPGRAGINWAAADSLARKLAGIENAPARPGKAKVRSSLEVSATELNSYLNLTLGPKMPPELSDVAFAIEPGRLAGTGLVDLDRLKAKMPPQGPWSPLNFLSGRVAVDLKTQLPSGDGVGNFVVEEVRLGGVSLPISLVQQVVLSATRNRENPAGFDLSAPFRLPYAVRQVRLEPGRAWLDF
jgi:hypothetical protein